MGFYCPIGEERNCKGYYALQDEAYCLYHENANFVKHFIWFRNSLFLSNLLVLLRFLCRYSLIVSILYSFILIFKEIDDEVDDGDEGHDDEDFDRRVISQKLDDGEQTDDLYEPNESYSHPSHPPSVIIAG